MFLAATVGSPTRLDTWRGKGEGCSVGCNEVGSKQTWMQKNTSSKIKDGMKRWKINSSQCILISVNVTVYKNTPDGSLTVKL